MIILLGMDVVKSFDISTVPLKANAHPSYKEEVSYFEVLLASVEIKEIALWNFSLDNSATSREYLLSR